MGGGRSFFDDLDKEAESLGIKLPKLPVKRPAINQFDDLIVDAGTRHGVDPDLLRAMTNQESSFRPNAVSPKNAQGLMQLIPATAERFGVKDPFDPAQNIEGGTKYMRWLLDRYNGDVDKALAGYNAGEGAVDRYNGIPPFAETRNYVKRIRSNYKGTGFYNKPIDFDSLDKQFSALTGKTDFDALDKEFQNLGGTLPKVNNITPQTDQNAQLEAYSKSGSNLPFAEWQKQTTQPIAPTVQTIEPKIDAVTPNSALSPAEQSDLDIVNRQAEGAVYKNDYGQDFSKSLDEKGLQQQEEINKKYQEYAQLSGQDPKSPETVKQFNEIQRITQEAADKENQREVQQSAVRQTPVRPNQQTQQNFPTPQPNYQKVKDEEYGKTLAGNVGVDLSKKPANMPLDEYIFRSGLEGVAGKYGLTQAEINRALEVYRKNGELIQGRGDLAQVNDNNLADYIKQHGQAVTYQVTREQIAAAKGNDELAKQDFRNEQIDNSMQAAMKDPLAVNPQNQDELDKQFRTSDYQNELAKQRDLTRLGIDPNLYAQAEQEVYTDPTQEQTESAVQKRYEQLKEASLSDEEKQAVKEFSDKLKSLPLDKEAYGVQSSGLGGILSGLGGISNLLAGFGRYIGEDEGYTTFRKLGNYAVLADKSLQSDNKAASVANFAGKAFVEVPKYVALSVLPGGAIVGFALDAGLQSYGTGSQPLVAFGNTAKGAVLGAIFHSAPKFQSLAEKGFERAIINPVLDKGKQAGADILLASKVFGTAARLGYVGIGTGTVEKLSGASTTDAFKAGIIMALSDLAFQGKNFGEIKDLAGKVFRMKNSKTGETADVTVEPDGEVKLLKGEVPPEAVDAEFDLSRANPEYLKFVNKPIIDAEVEPVTETKLLKGAEKAVEQKQAESTQSIVKNLDAQDISKTFRELTDAGLSPKEAGDLIETELAKRKIEEKPNVQTEQKPPSVEKDVPPVVAESEVPKVEKPSNQTTTADKPISDELNKFATEGAAKGGALEKTQTQQPSVTQEPSVENPTTYYHGTQKPFDKFDVKYSNPNNEHGSAVYVTNKEDESKKYGQIIKQVRVRGKILDEDLPVTGENKKVVTNLIKKLKKRGYKIDISQFKTPTTDIAIQEIARQISKDHVERQNIVNEVLKELGYSARQYTEDSGAKSLAVFDIDQIQDASPTTVEQKDTIVEKPKDVNGFSVGDRVTTGLNKGRITGEKNDKFQIRYDDGTNVTVEKSIVKRLENRNETVEDFNKLARQYDTYEDFKKAVVGNDGLLDRSQELGLNNLIDVWEKATGKTYEKPVADRWAKKEVEPYKMTKVERDLLENFPQEATEKVGSIITYQHQTYKVADIAPDKSYIKLEPVSDAEKRKISIESEAERSFPRNRDEQRVRDVSNLAKDMLSMSQKARQEARPLYEAFAKSIGSSFDALRKITDKTEQDNIQKQYSDWYKKLSQKEKDAILSKPEPITNEVAKKEPYEMTRTEFRQATADRLEEENKANKNSDYDKLQQQKRVINLRSESDNLSRRMNEGIHKDAVEQALKEGKTVPESVLADYPDLAEKYGKESPLKEIGGNKYLVPQDTDSKEVVNAKRWINTHIKKGHTELLTIKDGDKTKTVLYNPESGETFGIPDNDISLAKQVAKTSKTVTASRIQAEAETLAEVLTNPLDKKRVLSALVKQTRPEQLYGLVTELKKKYNLEDDKGTTEKSGSVSKGNGTTLSEVESNAQLGERTPKTEVQNLSPTQRASLRRKGTPEELEKAGLKPLGETGQFGQISYKLRQEMYKADSNLLSDLAKVFEPDVDLSDKNAGSAVLDKIAEIAGKDRSSQLSPSDWNKILDSNAGKLSLESVAKIEEALLHQSDWEARRDAFFSDRALLKFLGDVGTEIDNGAIKSFSDLKPVSKKAIIAKAKTYGLSEQTAKDTFNSAVSRYLERGNDESGSVAKSEGEAEESQDKTNQIDDGIQFTMAWHGSPHRFEKFDISKIGTGEGAQAYGHGLYFTDKEAVADHYRNNLSLPRLKFNGKLIEDAKLAPEEKEFAHRLEAMFQNEGNLETALDRVIGDVQRYTQFTRGIDATSDGELTPYFEEIKKEAKTPELAQEAIALAVKMVEGDESIRTGDTSTANWNRLLEIAPNADHNVIHDVAPMIEEEREIERIIDFYDKYKDSIKIDNGGAKYQVELKPKEDEYLLWDKPLSEQSEKVKKALDLQSARSGKEINAERKEITAELNGLEENLSKLKRSFAPDVHNQIVRTQREITSLKEKLQSLKKEKEFANKLDKKGYEFYKELADRRGGGSGLSFQSSRGDKAASEYLHSLGIRGIKYLDGTSRGKGEGSYNYVIFDDKDVEIQDILFSIIGEKGVSRLSDAVQRTDNLQVAREMEKAGKDAKSIWLATGWEKGGDGKWKTEIDDAKFFTNKSVEQADKLTAKIKLAMKKQGFDPESWAEYAQFIAENPKYEKTLNKVSSISGLDLAHNLPRKAKAFQNFLSEFEKQFKRPATLADIFPDAPFVEAYPELGKLPVKVESMPPLQQGRFDGKQITVSEYPMDLRSTLHHEVQHAIQEIEGFASGGSPSEFNDISTKQQTLDRLAKQRDKVWEALPDEIQKLGRIINRRDDTDGKALEQINKSPYKDKWQDYANAHKAYVEAANKPESEYHTISAKDQYKRLGGEVEARNVQTRLSMTDVERANKTLSETEDIDRKSQIYLKKGLGVANSVNLDKFKQEDRTLGRLLNHLYQKDARELSEKVTAEYDDVKGVVKLSPEAAALLRQAITNMRGKDAGAFYGFYAAPNFTESLKVVLGNLNASHRAKNDFRSVKAIRKIERAIDEGTKNKFKDLVVIVSHPSFLLIEKFAGQEEQSHRGDYRIRDFEKAVIEPYQELDEYNEAYKNLSEGSYKGANPLEIHNEIIAKLGRDDANRELGLSWDKVDTIEAFHLEQLAKAGVTPETYKEHYENISERAEKGIEKYERISKQINTGDAENVAGTGGQNRITAGSPSDARRGSGQTRTETLEGDRFAKLRQTEISSAGQSGNEVTALEKRYIESKLQTAPQSERDAVKLVKDDKGRLLAPNGRPSNLNENLWRTVRTPSFKKWSNNWKDSITDANGEPQVFYHGTDADFDAFKVKGQRLTALGLGYYFTPTNSKAEQYGSTILPVFLKAEKLLDWNNLSSADRKKITDILSEIPPSEIAGYGEIKEKVFDKNDTERAEKFFNQKQEETKDYFHDRAKAKLRSRNGDFVIQWREASLSNASNADLLALAQRYYNNIAQDLGYDGIKFGDEIAVVNSNQIKSIFNKGTFDAAKDEIQFAKAGEPKTPLAKKLFNQIYDGRGEEATPKKEVLVNFRRAGLLTSPKTHLRNIISNAAFQASEEAMRPVALLADLAASAVTGKRTVQAPSIPGVAKSFLALVSADKTMKGLNQESGIAKAWGILRNGDTQELAKNQLAEMRSGSPLLDKFVNYTFRALGAEDALFKVYAFRRSLEEQAKTTAITKARNISWKSPIEKLKYIRAQKLEMLHNPSKEMILEASLFADFSTFTNNNPISDWFKKVKDLSPSGKVVLETLVPYDKTPTNIILRTLEYSPVGFGMAGKHLIDAKRGKSYTLDNLRRQYQEGWSQMDKGREGVKGMLAERTLNLLEGSNKLKDELDRLENGTLTQAQEAHLNKLREAQQELQKVESRTPAQSKRLLKIQELIDRYTAPQPMTEKRYQRINELRKRLEKQQAKIDAYQKIKARRKVKNQFREEDRKAIEKAIEEFFPRFQQQQFAKSFGRAGFGTAALFLGVLLASKGLLSGVWDAGEEDEKSEHYNRQDKGILDGSLILGNRRYQIADTPLGKTMVAGASIWERSQMKLKKDESRTGKFFNDTADVTGSILKQQPLLNSLDDYFGSDKSVEKRVGGLLGSFVPAIFNDVADVSDDAKRETKGLLDFPANRVPILREQLPKSKYDREPYLRDRTNRFLNKFDPTNSRPVVLPKKEK